MHVLVTRGRGGSQLYCGPSVAWLKDNDAAARLT